MDINMISLIVSTVALLVALGTFYFWNADRKKPKQVDSFSTKPLQLQAYERLVMLAERIALPSLIGRVNQGGMTAREMQMLLLESIKQEYDYNATQQIYVSPVAWEAIRNLKDQTMLIVNQVAGAIP